MVTTIKLHDKTKEKLDIYKERNSNITYDDAIQSLLRKVGGTIVDDIHEIKREQVAFSLDHNGYDADGNRIEFTERHVTFSELEDSEVGDTFESEESNLVNQSNEIAEVMVKTDKDVFIRLCTIYENEDGVFEDYDMIHVVLF